MVLAHRRRHLLSASDMLSSGRSEDLLHQPAGPESVNQGDGEPAAEHQPARLETLPLPSSDLLANNFVGEQGVLVHNNCDIPASAREAIATISAKVFKPLQCTQCANAIVDVLKARGIPGQVLQIQAKAGDFIVSDLVKSGTTSITRNGYHEAVRVGDIVFDNFPPQGVAYDTYIGPLHAIDGITIKAVGF